MRKASSKDIIFRSARSQHSRARRVKSVTPTISTSASQLIAKRVITTAFRRWEIDRQDCIRRRNRSRGSEQRHPRVSRSDQVWLHARGQLDESRLSSPATYVEEPHRGGRFRTHRGTNRETGHRSESVREAERAHKWSRLSRIAWANCVMGVVKRVERNGNIFIDLGGNAEAAVIESEHDHPARSSCGTGDRIRGYLRTTYVRKNCAVRNCLSAARPLSF